MQKIVSLLLFLVPLIARAEAPAIRLIDFSGKSIAFSDVQRDATLVAFWMASCVPCIEEMPLLEALHKKSAGNARITVVGVNLDEDETLPAAKKILAAQQTTYPMLRDPKRDLVKKWFPENPRMLAMPTILVLDRAFHAVYSQGFSPGTSADSFIAEWSPHLAAASAGQLHANLERIDSQEKTKAIESAQKAQAAEMARMFEKMIRTKHPDLPDAEIKKRLDAVIQEFNKTGRVRID